MLRTRFRYILISLMSVLIINVGAGIMVVHNCCTGGSPLEDCCGSGCEQCAKTVHAFSEDGCKDHKCTVSVYKEVLAKHVQERVLPSAALPCRFLRGLLESLFPDFRLHGAFPLLPDVAFHPRERLSLLMVLII